MRIALVSSDVFPTPPESYGGLEIVVANLASRLCDLGHDVTLYALPGSRPDHRVRTVPLDDTPTFGPGLLEHDVIHYHGWHADRLWALASAHPQRAFVQTWHGPSMGLAAPPPNVVVCGVSRWHGAALAAELGASARGVPNGVRLADYPLYRGQRDDYLVSLNRLDPAKGIDRAIRLAREVGMPLRIAGPESGVPSEEYVRAVLTRCDGRDVVWEGSLTLGEKVPLLQRARALLWLGGWEEPFGLGIVEANACGTPVLGLARGAVPEILAAGGGRVVDTLGADLHAAHPAWFWHPDARSTPDRCRENAERFSDLAMAEAYLRVYAEVA